MKFCSRDSTHFLFSDQKFKSCFRLNRDDSTFLKTNSSGLSLVELLSVTAILSIILSTGIPSMNRWIQNATNESTLKLLFHLAIYTRTEAIKANDYFTMCPSTTLTSCGGSWSDGVIVFKDSNKNEAVDPDQGEVLDKSFKFSTNAPCIQWNRKDRQYLQFKPSGASNGTAGTFSFCQIEQTSAKKSIVISFNGRTSLRSL